ncbi:hypothetical protein [Jatrophihabitans sp.]|jgi:hypothetical protein|uniref:hypothetical protein n=1 Tax=Jatrophihabitans sp. TaxID=1932789 RepID=UPI002F0A2003
MIELPPPYQPPQPGPSEVRGRRGAALLAAAVVLVLVVVVALVNGHRNRDSAARQAADRVQQLSPAPSARPTPGSSDPNGGQAEPVPLVECPEIRDEESRLGYRCIDNALQQDAPDDSLGLRIALNQEVEPGWLISEGSGNPRSLASPPSNDTVNYRQNRNAAGPALPSDQQVRDEVRRRVRLAVERGYGDINPTSRTMAEHVRAFSGVRGYEVLTEITINPTFRASRHLTVRTERLWTVGLPTEAGVSIFMLSIPDNRADLWPKAEATVGTVHVL